MSSPLLSICIPTYNRSELLKEALDAVAPQVARANGVELIVSDNASTDKTSQVIDVARRKWSYIRYNRNPTNLGLAGNFLYITEKLAKSDFCWIVGDDDIVLPGGVARVLRVLRSRPDVDFVLLNRIVANSSRRSEFRHSISSDRETRPDFAVNKWEMLIDPHIDDWFLTGMMCSVFRLSLYRKFRISPNEAGHEFSRVETTYPHSVTFAHTMIGRRAYYIGEPCILVFWGHQERNRSLPQVLNMREQELLDLYEKVGVDPARVELFRRILLVRGVYALQRMLTSGYVIGREEFSLWRLIYRNRHHLGLLLKVSFLFLALPRVKPVMPGSIVNSLVAKTRGQREALIGSIQPNET